jgi:hypothetical protein
MFKVQIFALFISLFSFNVIAQNNDAYVFTGTVTDIESGETLPFASVFLANTTYGTVSNEQGEFKLVAKQPGSYDLIVKFAGYKTFAVSYQIFEPQTIIIDVNLELETRFLGGVTVTAKRDDAWRRNLEKFKRGFLGRTGFAIQTKILNEDKIEFIIDEENDVFEAFTKEPLIIENKALGYRLKYILEEYKVYNKQGLLRYYGFPVFEEMNDDKRPKKKWVKNRDMAYYGSTDHFFSALFNNELKKEGYRVQQAKKDDGKMYLDKNETDLFPTLSEGATINSKRLAFKDWLMITYTGGKSKKQIKPNFGGVTTLNAPNLGSAPVSEISMFEDKEFIEFDSGGYVYNPIDFVVNRYWSYLKIADLIPINYKPSVK